MAKSGSMVDSPTIMHTSYGVTVAVNASAESVAKSQYCIILLVGLRRKAFIEERRLLRIPTSSRSVCASGREVPGTEEPVSMLLTISSNCACSGAPNGTVDTLTRCFGPSCRKVERLEIEPATESREPRVATLDQISSGLSPLADSSSLAATSSTARSSAPSDMALAVGCEFRTHAVRAYMEGKEGMLPISWLVGS